MFSVHRLEEFIFSLPESIMLWTAMKVFGPTEQPRSAMADVSGAAEEEAVPLSFCTSRSSMIAQAISSLAFSTPHLCKNNVPRKTARQRHA